MKGNAKSYRKKAEVEDKQLRKLMKARNKYMNILQSIEREISECQENVKRNMHCLSVVSAETELSFISE